jgi:hypothetical protein
MNTEQDFDDFAKDMAWTAFWQGYREGYGVEDYDDIDRRTAMSLFERWWDRNA